MPAPRAPSSAALGAAELAGLPAGAVQLLCPAPCHDRAGQRQHGLGTLCCTAVMPRQRAWEGGAGTGSRLAALVQIFGGNAAPPPGEGYPGLPNTPLAGGRALASAARAPLPAAVLPAASSPAALALPTSELLRATWPPVPPVPPIAGARYARGDAVPSSSASPALGVLGTSGRAMSNMGRVCRRKRVSKSYASRPRCSLGAEGTWTSSAP